MTGLASRQVGLCICTVQIGRVERQIMGRGRTAGVTTDGGTVAVSDAGG